MLNYGMMMLLHENAFSVTGPLTHIFFIPSGKKSLFSIIGIPVVFESHFLVNVNGILPDFTNYLRVLNVYSIHSDEFLLTD